MESDYAYLTLKRGPVSYRQGRKKNKGDNQYESDQMDERGKYPHGNAQGENRTEVKSSSH